LSKDEKTKLRFLIEQGCEEIQGYYYYRPMPPEELEAILLARSRKA